MNVYQYIFYRLYRLLEKGEVSWWSDFRAAFLISAVEIAFLALVEYKIASLLSTSGADIYGMWGYILIICGPPLTFNYILFLYRERWKDIIKHFDKADKHEKTEMNLQMAIVLLLIVGLFILLLFL